MFKLSTLTLFCLVGFSALAEKSPKINASISNECVPRKGFYGDPGSAIAGATIKVYEYNGNLLTANAGSIFTAGTITSNADGSWIWKCNGSNACTAGANNCIINGTYAITQTVAGKTESDPIFICVGANNQSTKPVITGTNFSATGTVNGNAGASAGVTLYTQNGSTLNKIGFTTANASGNWSITGLTITPCDTLTALAVQSQMCLSAYADTRTEGGIQQVTITSDRGTAACFGDTITLTASQGTDITWSTGATTASIQVLSGGTYNVIYSRGTGCTTTASMGITFHTLPPTPVVQSMGGNQGCLGDTMTLYTTAQPGMSYSWRRYGITIPGATGTSVLINSPARYYVTYIDGNGCRAESDTFHVYSGPTAPTVVTSGSTVLCNNSTVTLSTTPVAGLNYQWRTYGNVITGANTTSFIARGTGRYTVTATNANGCSNTSLPVDVTVTPQMPTITASGSLAVCQGSGVRINTQNLSDVTYQWRRSGRIIPGATAPAYLTSGEGFFKVTITDLNGCSRTSDSVQVYFTPAKPVITATGSTTFCPGGSVTLQSNTIPNVNYLWKKYNTNVSNSNTTSINVNSTGRYRVQVTDQKGCTRTSDPIDVTASCRIAENGTTGEAQVYPNPSNGAFDFVLAGEDAATLEIQVYNSIGVAVPFEKTITMEGTVRIDGLIPGIYFASLKGKETSKVLRIIRE